MHYVIWTPVETEAFLNAVADMLKVSAVSNRMVMDLAAEQGCAWRPRSLTYAQAKVFLQKHAEELKAKVTPAPLTYAVIGYEQELTIEQLITELARLKSKEVDMDRAAMQHRIWRMTHIPVGATLTMPATSSTTPTLHTHHLKVKPRVAVAGIHTKHRHDLEQMFPGIIILWIEPGDPDANIKRKVSGHIALACTYGCNGKVMNLMQNVAAKFLQGGGVHFVKDALSGVQQGRLS